MNTGKKKGLGRGLSALFGDEKLKEKPQEILVLKVPTEGRSSQQQPAAVSRKSPKAVPSWASCEIQTIESEHRARTVTFHNHSEFKP